jgi:hypothetical protein
MREEAAFKRAPDAQLSWFMLAVDFYSAFAQGRMNFSSPIADLTY